MLKFAARFPLSFYAVLVVALPLLGLGISLWHDVPPLTGLVIGRDDPDPWLRLTLVRDWLSGGSWYSHVMLKSNAPWGGISSPWTRPLDVALAILTEIQPASVDLSVRLVRASFFIPTVWAVLLMTGIFRAMRILSPVRTAPFIAIALLMTSLGMWAYYNTGNADHHGLLAAVFIWAIGGLFYAEPTPKQILLSGLLFALQLWISPEALLLIGIVYGWYGLNWLSGTRDKTLPLLGTTIAFGAALAVMIERPPVAWLVPVYDSISVVYVFILTLAALLAWLLYFWQPRTMKQRVRLATAGALTLLFTLMYSYPAMLRGPMAEADPYIFTHFLPLIHEAQPPFINPPLMLLSMTFQPLLAMLFCMLAWWHHPAIYSRRALAQLLFFYAFAALLYGTEQRFYYYFYPLSVVLLAPMLAALLTPEDANARGRWPAYWMGAKPASEQMLWRMPLMMLVLIAPVVLLTLSPEPKTSRAPTVTACHTTLRMWIQDGALNNLGQGKSLIILGSTDSGGEMMFWTPHRIVASNYHREGAGIRYVWEADDITSAPELRRYLAKRQVDALFLCPKEAASATKGSILQGLATGKTPPAWLHRVPLKNLPGAKPANPPEATPSLFLIRRP